MARFHRKDRLSSKRRALPRLWLFTDERIGAETLFPALRRLPRGSGIVFRHYGLPRRERGALLDRIHDLSRKRDLLLLVAAAPGAISPMRADGIHRPGWQPRRARPKGMLLSMPAHNSRDLVAARRAGADIIFLSPVFPTRSHPGSPGLGPIRFGLLARQAKRGVIALGGMNPQRFSRLRPLGADGWAGIDALA